MTHDPQLFSLQTAWYTGHPISQTVQNKDANTKDSIKKTRKWYTVAKGIIDRPSPNAKGVNALSKGATLEIRIFLRCPIRVGSVNGNGANLFLIYATETERECGSEIRGPGAFVTGWRRCGELI